MSQNYNMNDQVTVNDLITSPHRQENAVYSGDLQRIQWHCLSKVSYILVTLHNLQGVVDN